MKVTLKDIATRTGYSVNTVSHALAGKTDIAVSTREEIAKVAAEMGYIRNSAASSLRSGKSGTIALILPDVANPNFIIMFRGIEAFFRQKSYTVFVLNTDESPEIERDAIHAALAQNVDGIILCPTADDHANLSYLASTGVPFCLIGRRMQEIDTDYVICDDELGGYLAATHLWENGHRQIAFFNGDLRISAAKERLAGIERALAEYGTELRPEHTLSLSVKAGGNKQQMRLFFEQHPKVSALITFSDLLAYEAICVLEDMGKRVPADLSVVGFDNICSDFSFPTALSSVSVSKKTMAAASAELLWERIEGRTVEEGHIILPTKLIERKTVKTHK
ncbi:MAG: LacI family DNA-binding transcriptional regulator [Clostridia bacterium]|nr:LacI family DNA-binding transcriptional regulator [Clostridia bacterium]